MLDLPNNRTSDRILPLQTLNDRILTHNKYKKEYLFTCFIDFRKDFDFHWPNGLFKEQHLRTLQTLNVTLKLNSKGGIFHYRKARRTFTKKKKQDKTNTRKTSDRKHSQKVICVKCFDEMTDLAILMTYTTIRNCYSFPTELYLTYVDLWLSLLRTPSQIDN